MLKVVCLLVAVCATGVLSQLPSPCIVPIQLTMRATEVNHADATINRFYIEYDAVNKRKVIFEEENAITPGRQFHQFIILNNENVEYDFNRQTRECTRSTPRPWRPFAIPANATFENEFTIGGPSEQVFAQEWSDRVPLVSREFWIGVFSLRDCFPIREIIISNDNLTTSITANYYDIVAGIDNPNDFVPPPECAQAKTVERKHKHFF